MKLHCYLVLSLLSFAGILPAAAPPEPYGPVPSPRQLRWHDVECYGFLHFSINTFTDKEWGYGDESPAQFNPTAFDADQIAGTAKEAGLRGLVLTCKHHDGFCLWPSQYTEHSVKHSPWKDGKGDVVREISDACRRHGLKFGVYLSPWDRNHKDYARPEYLTYYRNQLRELLTNYGPIFEMWFDGANGGDGYYGGARERRNIDNRTYYDWDNTWKIVRELQPDACMFSDAGPDVRWVGNESGFAGQTCWATFTRASVWPGHADPQGTEPGRPGGQGLAAGRGGCVDPSRLVLSRVAGQQGEDAGPAAGHLLQLGGPRREPDPEPAARPPRDHPRERRPVRCASGGGSWRPPSPRIWRPGPRPRPATPGAETPSSPRPTWWTANATPTGPRTTP